MDPLPPIPTPAGARWRKWRNPVAHVLMFGVACALVSLLWVRLGEPAYYIGQVEVIESTVSSRDSGYITNLWVAPLQEVKPGDLLAEVVTTDPRTVNNRLEAMRDRMRLTALEWDPILRRERTTLDYEQLSVECDRINTELEIARVRLEHATIQLQRDSNAFAARVVSAEVLDLSRRNKDAFEVEVREKSNHVARAQKVLDRLQSLAETFTPGGENDPIRQALEVEEDKMRVFEAKVAPLRLYAPTGGVVTAIFRRMGEQVLAGDPIAIITCSEATRITALLPERQTFTPRIGMEVEVVTRHWPRVRGFAQIIGVSPHLLAMTNSPTTPIGTRHATVFPMGRLVSVSLPPDLPLLPGELVNLRFPVKQKQQAESSK
jgi:multidrug resistance efflux pump